jgi:hypothetical protein
MIRGEGRISRLFDERRKPMAIAYLLEFSGMSPEQSANVLKELGLESTPPAGQVVHIEGPMESGGVRVVDVWESQEAMDAFFRDRLMPAFQKVGVAIPADSKPTAVWPVSAVLK